MVEHFRSLRLTESAVRRVVSDCRDEWTVTGVDGIPGSANSLYAVDLSSANRERTVICKCSQNTAPVAFRPEPYLLEAISRRTTVPVPAVLAVVEDDSEDAGPLFVMEQCDGEGVATRARELEPAIRERIARDAGRYLGQIHDLGSFDRFGAVRLGRDVDHNGSGLETPNVTLTVAENAHDEWADALVGLATFFLSNLDDRFVDLEGPIRKTLDERCDVLNDPNPVLMHDEYTYWNTLVDPNTGETTAVLDFEDQQVGCAEYDLAAAIDSLSALAPLGSARRRRVRDAVYEGYEETNGLIRDSAFAARRDLYRLVARLPMLAFFKSGMVVGPDSPETLVREHRAFLSELL
ncbi:phosphotransferase [Natronolimnobius sp. AArcel1]|uniref:phosphotransferase family protein n=1 Tax=Natronolimnobius sp. AArcel1 TaxID=1679093 RepID=UPI0013EB18EB|nr:phosphotransferase [Natronolimnobius sp. AArcel1]NGM68531.1 phosphotransferase [Natronolimnobius sp. AArcel1]